MIDKKIAILNIADKLFARYGYQKTTMEDIASTCRMAKSSIYYYFQNKDEIFAEVIKQDSLEFRKKLNEAVDSVKQPQARITAYVIARLRHLRELTNYYVTLTDEYLEHHNFIEETRNDFYEYEKNKLKELLQAGVNQQKFKVPDPDLTARMISIIIKGLEYPLLISKSNIDPESEIPQLLNILFAGIIKDN